MAHREKELNKLIVLQTYGDCNKTDWPRLVSWFFASNKRLSIQLNQYMIHIIHWAEGCCEGSLHSTSVSEWPQAEAPAFWRTFPQSHSIKTLCSFGWRKKTKKTTEQQRTSGRPASSYDHETLNSDSKPRRSWMIMRHSGQMQPLYQWC